MKTNGYLRVSLLILSVCFGLSCSYSLYAQPVNDQLNIQGSDSKLYLEVAGDDANKPLVLFLHGGPGNVVLGLDDQTSLRELKIVLKFLKEPELYSKSYISTGFRKYISTIRQRFVLGIIFLALLVSALWDIF